MKLHTHPLSQHCRRVMMLCAESDLEIDTQLVDLLSGEHKSDEFLAMSPFGQLPVLEDGDYVLAESHAIMKYLISDQDDPALYPKDPKARANIDMWMDWTHSKLNPPIQTITIHTLVLGDNGDKELVAKSQDEAVGVLDILEKGIQRREGIGGQLSMADLCIASTLAQYEMSGGSLSAYPHTSAWFDGIKGRASFQNTAPTSA